MKISSKTAGRTAVWRAAACFVAALSVVVMSGAVQAATLTTASVGLSDPRPGSVSRYDVLASNVTTATTVRCILVAFSANYDGTGGVPTGMTSTAATVDTAASTFLASHTGWVLAAGTNGTLKYTNTTGATPAVGSGAHFVLANITNGSQTNDDKFLTFSTYSNADCATGPVDTVTTGFIFTDGQQVTIGVDGSLSFAVAGVANGAAVNGATTNTGVASTSTSIPFGTLTASTNKVAAQDLTVSTNSGLGYTVSTRYTGAPAVNSYTISDLTGGTNTAPSAFSAAGTEGFGYTTEDTTLGTSTANRFLSNKWAAFTTTNAEVAYHNAPVAAQTTRVGFQAGISGATEPGAYTTTVIYTATPVY